MLKQEGREFVQAVLMNGGSQTLLVHLGLWIGKSKYYNSSQIAKLLQL
jgi:hypothetical protein